MLKKLLLFAALLIGLAIATVSFAQPDVEVISPNVMGLSLQAGQDVSLNWQITESGQSVSALDSVTISLKRDDQDTQDCLKPDDCPQDWIRLATNTLNDGTERLIIPAGLTEASDWFIFVAHNRSGDFDRTAHPFTYQDMTGPEFALNIFIDGVGAGKLLEGESPCGPVCEALRPDGNLIELRAVPETGFELSFIEGCDSLNDDVCQVTMDRNRSVTTRFVSPSTCTGDGFPRDCDGDALPDQWEVSGLEQDGATIDLACYGARVGEKDLFLWLDHMEGQTKETESLVKPSDTTRCTVNVIELLERSFLERVVNLHFEWAGSTTSCLSGTTVDHVVPFEEESSDLGIAEGLPAQKKDGGFVEGFHDRVFRYALLFNDLREGFFTEYRGRSTIQLRDDICQAISDDVLRRDLCSDKQAIGAVIRDNDGKEKRTPQGLAATLMHELGHSLSFGHGGSPNPDLITDPNGNLKEEVLRNIFLRNRKPNYVSIMNYIYLDNGEGVCLQRGNDQVCPVLDYSVFDFFDLDSGSLSEPDGVLMKHGSCLPVGDNPLFPLADLAGAGEISEEEAISSIVVRYFDKGVLSSSLESSTLGASIGCGGDGIDWNGNNEIDSERVEAAIFATTSDGVPDPLPVLFTGTDWDNIRFGGWNIGKNASKSVYLTLNDDTSSDPLNIASDPIPQRRYFQDFFFRAVAYEESALDMLTEPGKRAAVALSVFNGGLRSDTYTVQVSSPAQVLSIEPEVFSLAPGQRQIVQAVVRVPVDQSVGDELLLRLSVKSSSNPLRTGEETFRLLVSGDLPVDQDEDHLPDNIEVSLGLDPTNPDTDGDGVFDGIEVVFTSDPEDRDGDGLMDALDGDNLTPVDSDGDGLSDQEELSEGLDPSDIDSDGDGLSDGIEFGSSRLGGSPVDYDGDGIIDALEVGEAAFDGSRASGNLLIDIKPGSTKNPINPKSRGKIPVAILGTAIFNPVTDLSQDSLTFGRTGVEPSLHRRGNDLPNCGEEDVNGDGFADLVCHFETEFAGFQNGDTKGFLRGQLNDGTDFEAMDAITIVGNGHDEDSDGVDDEDENRGPNDGDANGDGIGDDLQANVTTLPAAVGDGFITLVVDPACVNASVAATTAAGEGLPADPEGLSFPEGLLRFELLCTAADVQVIFHGQSNPQGFEYRRFGPTPDDPVAHWYSLPTAIDAVMIGNQPAVRAAFQLSDGNLGDDVLIPDGKIVDPGGIATASAVMVIPTLSQVGLALLIGGLLLAGVFLLLRQRGIS